jgi:hypothetical protein
MRYGIMPDSARQEGSATTYGLINSVAQAPNFGSDCWSAGNRLDPNRHVGGVSPRIGDQGPEKRPRRRVRYRHVGKSPTELTNTQVLVDWFLEIPTTALLLAVAALHFAFYLYVVAIEQRQNIRDHRSQSDAGSRRRFW